MLNGESATLSESPDYRLHVEKEEKYLSSKACERDREFWRETMSGAGLAVSLKDHINADLSPVGQRMTFSLSDKLNHMLNDFCESHRVAPFAVFYMAIAVYLKRIRNADKICLGAPIHNRMDITDRQTTGMFVSTLPFFTELDEELSFEEFNRHLADDWLDLLRHQRLPFSEIISAAKETDPAFEKPFHLVLSFHNSKAYRNRDTLVSFSGQWHYAGYQAEHICIHLNNIADERRYTVNYDYLSQLYSKYEIEDFHHYLINILMQALAFPARPIRELSLLGEEEEEKVLYSFNRTDAFYFEGNLSQKLEEICRRHPERVAVICSGCHYTYKDLWDRANAAAREIFSIIPDGKEIAAVLLPKSYQLFCALAGIMRSGCAWVIISPQLPKQRIRQILSDSNASVVLSAGDLAERLLLQGKRFAEKHGLSVPRKIIHTLNAKPRFADANVFFSVSHSGSYWACAFANAEIGLDIQRFQPCLAESIARRFFHPNEAAWVKDRGDEAFFAVWTAKESYVKFTGEGITDDFAAFSVVDSEENIDRYGNAVFRHIPFEKNYSLCICTPGKAEVEVLYDSGTDA